MGLIVQSGGNCIYAIRDASQRGVFFSKAISYGNAADINETELLDFMADDPDTKLIGMYIEGVKDGRHFSEVMKKAAQCKPLIIYKAGNTDTGARACASHTSAMAGSAVIWQGVLKQAGVVQVGDMPEVADMGVTFSRMPLPAGRNTVVIGTGGGVAVQAADDITGAGLHLQVLPVEVRRKLHDIYGTEAGSIYRNPVDIPPFGGADNFISAVKAIAEAPQVHILILHFSFDIWAMVSRSEPLKLFMGAMSELAGTFKKPVAAVLHNNVDPMARQLADQVQEKLVAMGYPVYPSIPRAAAAINKYIQYWEWRKANR
jgi:acyl-CoA synthetase (NDP forming)